MSPYFRPTTEPTHCGAHRGTHHGASEAARTEVVRTVTVAHTAEITTTIRRLTLSGEQLQSYTADGITYPALNPVNIDDRLRVILTTPTDEAKRNSRADSPGDKAHLSVVSANVSVRRVNQQANELEVEITRHGDGAIYRWAESLRPGDSVQILGIAEAALPESDSPKFRMPMPSARLLIFADSFALTPVARLLEEFPNMASTDVILCLSPNEIDYPLPEDHGVRIVRVPLGDESETVPEIRRALDNLAENLDPSTPEAPPLDVWIAGEQLFVESVRDHLVGVGENYPMPISPASIFTTVYDQEQGETSPGEADFQRFLSMAGILPALALRAAANLNLGVLISEGSSTVDDLVEKTDTCPEALRKFLRYLESIGILEALGGPIENRTGYRLSTTGQFLSDRHVLDHLTSDGVASIREQAFFGIEDAVRSGRPAYKKITGRSWTQQRLIPDFEQSRLDQISTGARLIGAQLAKSEAIVGAQRVVIHSDGAGSLAAALIGTLPEVAVVIPAMPTQAAWLNRKLREWVPVIADQERITVVEQARYDPTPVADTIIIARELVNHADADAVMFLRRAASCLSAHGRILLIEPTFDCCGGKVPDPKAATVDLLNLAVVGSGYRTAEEVEALVATSGLRVIARESLGPTLVRTLLRTP